MLRVNERCSTPVLLSISDDVQRKCCLTRGFVSVKLDDTPLGKPSDSKRKIKRKGSGRNHRHVLFRLFSETQNRHLSELFADVLHYFFDSTYHDLSPVDVVAVVVEQPNAVDMINKPSAFLRCSVNLDHIKTVTLIPVIGTAPVIAGDHEITELSFVNAAKPSAERREILVLLDFNEHKRIARPFIGDDVDFKASVPLVGRYIALEDLVPLGTKEFARNPLAPQTVTDAQISIVTQQWHCAAP